MPKIVDMEKASEIICRATRMGLTQVAAAGMAGITARTLHVWLKKGIEEEEGRFRDFVTDYEAAYAQVEGDVTEVVMEEAVKNRNWQAASWWLSRRRKADYAPKQEVSQESKVEITDAPTVAEARKIMQEEFGGVTPQEKDGEGKDG